MLTLKIGSAKLEQAVLGFLAQYDTVLVVERLEDSSTRVVEQASPIATQSNARAAYTAQDIKRAGATHRGRRKKVDTRPEVPLRQYARAAVRAASHPLTTGQVYEAIRKARGDAKRRSVYNALRTERIEGMLVYLNDGTWAPSATLRAGDAMTMAQAQPLQG